jgi:hypothetical protein
MANSVADRRRNLNLNFHFDADPDPDPTPSFTHLELKIFFTFHTAVPVPRFFQYFGQYNKNFCKYSSAFRLVEKDMDSVPDRHALDDDQASDPDSAK